MDPQYPDAPASLGNEWRPLALVVLRVATITFAIGFLLAPTSSGEALQRSMLDARQRIGSIEAGIDFAHGTGWRFAPTRDSILAIARAEAGLVWYRHAPGLSEARRAAHIEGMSRGVTHAVKFDEAQPCLVKVSAQALEAPQGATAQLIAAIGRDEALRYLLLHEYAHCQFNPLLALARAERDAAHPKEGAGVSGAVATPPGALPSRALVERFAESYADAWAVLALWMSAAPAEREAMRPVIDSIAAWRGAASGDPSGGLRAHATRAAIDQAMAFAADPGGVAWISGATGLRSRALDAALSDAYGWLAANGVDAQARLTALDELGRLADFDAHLDGQSAPSSTAPR